MKLNVELHGQPVGTLARIKNWRGLVTDVFAAVSQWPRFAQAQGLPLEITNNYLSAIEQGPCYRALKAA